jgi:hypothetical protein
MLNASEGKKSLISSAINYLSLKLSVMLLNVCERHLINLRKSKRISLRYLSHNIMQPIWTWFQAKNPTGLRANHHRRHLSHIIQAG